MKLVFSKKHKYMGEDEFFILNSKTHWTKANVITYITGGWIELRREVHNKKDEVVAIISPANLLYITLDPGDIVY
jgi:hypothetical protein